MGCVSNHGLHRRLVRPKYSLRDAHQRPSRCMEGGQEAATLMLRGRQASLVRLMPSLCTGMVNTMTVPRCWLAFGCKGSCCPFCGSHSAGGCAQTLLAAVPSSLQTRHGTAVRPSAACSVASPLPRPVRRHCSLWTPAGCRQRRAMRAPAAPSGAPTSLAACSALVLAASEGLQARH